MTSKVIIVATQNGIERERERDRGREDRGRRQDERREGGRVKGMEGGREAGREREEGKRGVDKRTPLGIEYLVLGQRLL